jgi:hypothetical protein
MKNLPAPPVQPPAPPRVSNIETFWNQPPSEQSTRTTWWVKRIAAGWRGNRRVSRMAYYQAAAYFGVYIWEYLHTISWALREMDLRRRRP